ncbi:MAG: NAD(P)-binding domain-containing protein [Acidimicrobiales bacterium]
MTPGADVAIVGAGAYGLALAAHLSKTGTSHVVYGDPFSAWRCHMPRGMLLKSEPYASDVAAPEAGYHLKDYCAVASIGYVERGSPLSLDTFVAYSQWFADRLVPDVNQAMVTSFDRGAGSYLVRDESGAELRARRVVVAVGIVPFAHVPSELGGLPGDLVSHASAHPKLDGFAGRRVAVVGAGQSAFETAALLHEHGAEVEVLCRASAVSYTDPNPEPSGFAPRLRRPVTKLCEGWRCWFYFNLPDVFRSFSEPYRALKSYRSLGPSVAWWLRPRVDGLFPVRTGTRIVGARSAGSGVELSLASPSNGKGPARFDHVIAGTGYRYDLARLGCMSAELRRSVVVGPSSGAPVLSRCFESSVPGLYFVGPLAAPSMGPLLRFLAGTHFTTKRIVARLSQ